VYGLQLRKYFRRFGSEYVNYATVMKEFSVTRREAEKILEELLKLEMICLCELQGNGIWFLPFRVAERLSV